MGLIGTFREAFPEPIATLGGESRSQAFRELMLNRY